MPLHYLHCKTLHLIEVHLYVLCYMQIKQAMLHFPCMDSCRHGVVMHAWQQLFHYLLTDHMPFTITLLHAADGASLFTQVHGMVLCPSVRFLCNQLFLPFTLCKSYLLLLHHVHQAHVRSNNCSSTMMHRDIDRYTIEHPHATQQ